MTAPRRVVVVGAGITGLVCAHALLQRARASRRPLDVVVLDAAEHAGGKVHTVRRDGFLLEAGPDSFHRDSRHLLQLAGELGLAHKLVASRPVHAAIFARQLHRVPHGVVMGVPTDARALRRSKLLSAPAAERALRGPAAARLPPREDLSLQQFFQERFGAGYTERVVAPLLSGIYGHPLSALGIDALLPRLHALASTGADLRRALVRSHASNAGMFLSFGDGMSTLPTALAAAMPATTVRYGWPVEQIVGSAGRYAVRGAGGRSVLADAVVLAVPAGVAARLLDAKPIFSALCARSPASAVSVQLGFVGDALPATRHRSGFLVGSRYAGALVGASFSHRKWPHVAPSGSALVRCMLGGRDLSTPDAALVEMARTELGTALGRLGTPDLVHVTRWPTALPAYLPGHRAALARVRAALAHDFPNVLLAGAAYDGVSLESCVRQGQDAAAAVMSGLGGTLSLQHEEPASC